jgi:hypothetical protein
VVGNYPDLVKEFVVYTLLRLVLFAASFAIVAGIWLAVADEVPVMWVFVIAFVISGLASYFVLNPQRERFAQRVEERARRASAAFEAHKAREDAD